MAAGGGAGNGHTWDSGAYPGVRQDAGHGSDARDGGISRRGCGDPRRHTGDGCDPEVGAGGRGDTWFVEARNTWTGRHAAARYCRGWGDAGVGAGGRGDTWFVEARNAWTGRHAAARCFRCVFAFVRWCVCACVCMCVDQI